MITGTNMNYYMLDGTPSGIVKCTLDGWTGLIYKIPRTKLGSTEVKQIKALSYHGVYLLLGECTETGTPTVYVGQVSTRKNKKGPLSRFSEHGDRVWWNTIIFFTTTDNSFNFSEISYLEHALYQRITALNSYTLSNAQTPSAGNMPEEKASGLLRYLHNANIILGALGVDILEPVRKAEATPPTTAPLEDILTIPNKQVKATGQVTSNGFILFAGTIIKEEVSSTCPTSVKNYREKYAKFINSLTLTKDLFFTSPSAAAAFVLGYAVNGRTTWKNSKGQTLADIEENLD